MAINGHLTSGDVIFLDNLTERNFFVVQVLRLVFMRQMRLHVVLVYFFFMEVIAYIPG